MILDFNFGAAAPTLLLFFLIPISAGGYIDGRGWNSIGSPVFEPTRLSVTVFKGETAELPCRVRNLSDKMVSWIRRKDLHIISSAGFMFTGDSRFQIIHPEGDLSSWSLMLRNAKPEDSGLYECQVNTDPKMKQAVLLTVQDGGKLTTSILGPRERYVKSGNSITLTCHSQDKTPEVSGTGNSHQRPHRLVDWLHDDGVIIFDFPRSGVSVDTEKVDRELSSQLTLASVTASDAGKYTCKPYNSEPYSILLVVFDGEHTEAMQSPSSSTITTASLSTIFTLLIFVL